MNSTKYVLFCTPKSYKKAVARNYPEQFRDMEIVACTDIYMNMIGGWTEDECDNVLYIVERDSFKPKFAFKNPAPNKDGGENE